MANEKDCAGCGSPCEQDTDWCEGCEEYVCPSCRKYPVGGMHFVEDHWTIHQDERQEEMF